MVFPEYVTLSSVYVTGLGNTSFRLNLACEFVKLISPIFFVCTRRRVAQLPFDSCLAGSALSVIITLGVTIISVAVSRLKLLTLLSPFASVMDNNVYKVVEGIKAADITVPLIILAIVSFLPGLLLAQYLVYAPW